MEDKEYFILPYACIDSLERLGYEKIGKLICLVSKAQKGIEIKIDEPELMTIFDMLICQIKEHNKLADEINKRSKIYSKNALRRWRKQSDQKEEKEKDEAKKEKTEKERSKEKELEEYIDSKEKEKTISLIIEKKKVKNEKNIKESSINIEPKKVKKEPEKHFYAPCVKLTEDEYSKLVTGYGKEGAAWMIQKLDDYKAARGTVYKSDYRAILNWVVKEYQKEQIKQINGTNQRTNYYSRFDAEKEEKRKRDEEFSQFIADTLAGRMP